MHEQKRQGQTRPGTKTSAVSQTLQDVCSQHFYLKPVRFTVLVNEHSCWKGILRDGPACFRNPLRVMRVSLSSSRCPSGSRA